MEEVMERNVYEVHRRRVLGSDKATLGIDKTFRGLIESLVVMCVFEREQKEALCASESRESRHDESEIKTRKMP